MNPKFLQCMQEMLGAEYDSYLSCLQEPKKRGFRINPLKTSDSSEFDVFRDKKSPFAYNGWYLKEDVKGVGFSPEYLSGCMYIQEPSASSAVTILNPEKEMKVADLCAAPGSKTTQIAELLGNTGFLLANEIDSKRGRILLENIERCGTTNCLVTNNSVQEIAKEFEGFFDMVLCDAPCSGEGMFRKEDEEDIDWSEEGVLACARRQAKILDGAYRCLRKGGTLVYSTCTFSKEENEENILSFLKRHDDMKLIPIDVDFGRCGFDIGNHTDFTRRIFPMDEGEGHFIAKMVKDGNETVSHSFYENAKLPKEVKIVLEDLLEKSYPYYYIYQNKVYGGTHPFYDTHSLHILRNQVYLGEMKNGRFEPSHHLFLSAYTPLKRRIELTEEEMKRYYHGEEIPHSCDKGFTSVTYHDHVLGGAKSDGKHLKNRYPKGLRIR